MNFYYNNNIGKFKKKNGACVFLAGKFATCEQMLLTKPINNFFKEVRRMRILSARIFIGF